MTRQSKSATLQAARVPLKVAEKSVEVMELAYQAASLGNLNAISDGATGSALARAALTGAGYNVRINVASLQNKSLGEPLLDELRQLDKRAAEIEAQIRQVLKDRGGMPLE